jgi:hypothetical protein
VNGSQEPFITTEINASPPAAKALGRTHAQDERQLRSQCLENPAHSRAHPSAEWAMLQ